MDTVSVRLASLMGFDDVSDVLSYFTSLESQEDIKEYLTSFLGNSKDVREFTKDFLVFKETGWMAGGEDTISCAPSSITNKNADASPFHVKIPTTKVSQSLKAASASSSITGDDIDRVEAPTKIPPSAARQKVLDRKKPPSFGKKAAPPTTLLSPNDIKTSNTNNSKLPPTAKPAPHPATPNDMVYEDYNLSSYPSSTPKTETLSEKATTKLQPLTCGTNPNKCGCYGTVHKILTNCLVCGRIACSVEGYSYCCYCTYYISAVKPKKNGKENSAVVHKQRLLMFDRENAARTVILDDQSDYFQTSISAFSTGKERDEAKLIYDKEREDRHGNRSTMGMEYDLFKQLNG